MKIEGHLATTREQAITFHAIEESVLAPRVEVFTTAGVRQGRQPAGWL